MNQRNRTFAHVVRADGEDPMRQMTIDSNMDIPVAVIKRVGRPRQPWIVANFKWLYEEEHLGLEYDHDNAGHKLWVQAFFKAGFQLCDFPTGVQQMVDISESGQISVPQGVSGGSLYSDHNSGGNEGFVALSLTLTSPKVA